jgi:hypothetical protein
MLPRHLFCARSNGCRFGVARLDYTTYNRQDGARDGDIEREREELHGRERKETTREKNKCKADDV